MPAINCQNFYCTLLFLLLITQCNSVIDRETYKEQLHGMLGDSAMVVSANPIATRIGLSILKRKGNAFDAAIAVHFALAVVHPRAGNIGGGGFAVYRLKNGKIGSLDFRETAPLHAKRNMFLDSLGQPISNLSLEGPLASGVPGSIDGVFELHKKFGSIAMSDLIEPAIQLAEKGSPITKAEADRLNKYKEKFQAINKRNIPTIKEKEWQEGDTIVFKELGATLRRIQKYGRDEFYKGQTANFLIKEMQRSNGLVTDSDLITYKSKWREPIVSVYKNYRIITMPPPSSGGIALCQMLNGAARYNFRNSKFQSAQSVHELTEIERRVFADRAKYLGDPDYYKFNINQLLDSSYLNQKFSTINVSEASSPTDTIFSGYRFKESYETTHFSVVDMYGNAIAFTTTLNGNYGSYLMVEKAGFFLNNQMDDFSVKPGSPNQFGLVGSEANSIVPGKRMLSSMTPTIIEKDGQLFMVIGATGGPTIITSVFQTVLNVVEYNMSMQDAINSKRFHHQWLPDFIMTDNDSVSFSEEKHELEKLGHHIKFISNLGQVSAILKTVSGVLEGASDKIRSPDDTAAGF